MSWVLQVGVRLIKETAEQKDLKDLKGPTAEKKKGPGRSCYTFAALSRLSHPPFPRSDSR